MTGADGRAGARARKSPRDIEVAHVYDPPGPGDACRVLVDRIWPRGVSKQTLRFDRWMKEIAPSSELRRWFHRDPGRSEEFRRRHFRELEARTDLLVELLESAEGRPLVLLYAARDARHNNAVALREYLQKLADGESP